VDINLVAPGLAIQKGLVAPGTQFTSSATLNQIRPYLGYSAINTIQDRFNSNYHSLQAFLQQRFAGNSYANVAYTWSKNLTDNQTDRSTAPQNPYDIRSEYGRAQLDRRHVLTFNYVYEIPYMRDQRGLVGHVVGGWQISGITTFMSGLPFTPTINGIDPAGIGFLGASAAGGRPVQVCDPNSGGARTFQSWFNTACFIAPPAGSTAVGNAGRGVINGPPTQRWDLTLTKNIRIAETVRAQFRTEVFNVFNHTNFTTLNTTVGNAAYGTVTGTRDPRTIQVGLKLLF
jgi:hypothetical protein